MPILDSVSAIWPRIPLTRGQFHERREGEVLHPGREPRVALDRIRAGLGSAHFEAQYQQQPVPAAGIIVQAEWLARYSGQIVPRPGDLVIQSWDTATKEGLHNDYSVCVTAVLRDRQVYVIDVFRERLAFPKLLREVVRLANFSKAQVLLIEDAASGAQLIQTLRHETPMGVPRPLARKPEGDKLTRLDAQSVRIESGVLRLPQEAPWLAAFERELLGFPNSKFDDQVDALAQLLAWVGTRRQVPAPAVGEIISIDGKSDEEYYNDDDPERFGSDADDDGVSWELY